jgi:hypothetical protein
MVLVADVAVVVCVTAVACIQKVEGILAVARVLKVPLVGLSAIAYVPGETNGVVGVSDVPFEDAVAGDPAVIGFSAVEGVLPVASVPADPGDHILAGGLHIGLENKTYYTIGLSDFGYRKFKIIS